MHRGRLAAGALIISLGLALKADGSWVDVAFDFVGLASLGAGAILSRLASRAFPAVRPAVAGTRASQAHRARYGLKVPDNLTELRRLASVAGPAPGDTVAARRLLSEVQGEARCAATAARSSTLAPFPVTGTQRFVDGGLDASRVHRQSAEMLLDLRTMPVAPPAGLLDDATRLNSLSTRGIVATNTVAGAQVVQSRTDPNARDGGNLEVLTDVIVRAR